MAGSRRERERGKLLLPLYQMVLVAKVRSPAGQNKQTRQYARQNGLGFLKRKSKTACLSLKAQVPFEAPPLPFDDLDP